MIESPHNQFHGTPSYFMFEIEKKNFTKKLTLREKPAKAHRIEGLENYFLVVPGRYPHQDEEKRTNSQTGPR